MDFLQIIVLSIVQGITEFLPVSSSAHLILVPVLTDWEDQGLAFDVAVHVGTLSAVVYYFRKDIANLLTAWVRSLATRKQTQDSKIAWFVILGTIPAALCGLLFKDFIEEYLRSPLVIATTTIVFGLILWWADAAGRRTRTEKSMAWQDVALIGGAQALALIPGTSRSGITMTIALALGFTREVAARFSFLLSIPLISLAGGYLSYKLAKSGEAIDWMSLGLGVVLSAISAYICIHFFLKMLERMGMMPFVIYRIFLGAFLFFMFW